MSNLIELQKKVHDLMDVICGFNREEIELLGPELMLLSSGCKCALSRFCDSEDHKPSDTQIALHELTEVLCIIIKNDKSRALLQRDNEIYDALK